MSSVIPGAKLSQARRWQMPVVESVDDLQHADEHTGAGLAHSEREAARECEAIRQQAREEGLQQGYSDGLEAARAETAARLQRLECVLTHLARPLEEHDQAVEQELVELTVAVARQVIRREVKLDRSQILGVVREARNALPTSARDVTILLHPDDADILRELIVEEDDRHPWRVREEPTISPGGCTILTDSSYVDATIEGRVAKIASELLGDERRHDRSVEADRAEPSG